MKLDGVPSGLSETVVSGYPPVVVYLEVLPLLGIGAGNLLPILLAAVSGNSTPKVLPSGPTLLGITPQTSPRARQTSGRM